MVVAAAAHPRPDAGSIIYFFCLAFDAFLFILMIGEALSAHET
jgi:hypothetical protein